MRSSRCHRQLLSRAYVGAFRSHETQKGSMPVRYDMSEADLERRKVSMICKHQSRYRSSRSARLRSLISRTGNGPCVR